MPLFLTPLWLISLLPIAAIGLVALWRGRHNLQPVSSTKLWAGLVSQSGGSKTRSLDPVWALLLVAALLAALALARPAWRPSVSPVLSPPVLQMSIRGIAGQPTVELFVRSAPNEMVRDPLTLKFDDGVTHPVTLSPDALRQGTVLSDIPNASAINIHVTDGPASVAYSFIRQDAPPFSVLRIGTPMPALERIIALQPGAQSPEATPDRAVWLIDDPSFVQSNIAAGVQGIAIVSSRTPMDGISSTAPTTGTTTAHDVPPPAITPQITARSPLLANVSFQDVHVYHWANITASPDWNVLATVDGHPWLAARTDTPKHILWIWMASSLSPKDTNWPLDPSFVIFFTNVAAQLRDNHPASLQVLEWTQQSADKNPSAAAPAPPIALSTPLLLGSIVLIIAVMAILARRA